MSAPALYRLTMLLHSAATALLQRPHTKQSAGFLLPRLGRCFRSRFIRTSSFPLLNICSMFHIFIFSLFPQNAFITAFPLCGHLRFFRKTKDFRYSRLRSVSPHSAVFSCFPKTLAGIFYRESSECSNRESCRLFSKNSTERFSSPDNPKTVRLFSRHSSPVFPALFRRQRLSMARHPCRGAAGIAADTATARASAVSSA